MDKKKISKPQAISIIMSILSLTGYYHYRKSSLYSKYFHFVNKLKKVPENLQIVNLGTTGAYYAFDYLKCKFTGMNMAIYTQPFSYDLKLLQKYEKNINKKAVILITIEYPIFLFPNIPKGRLEVYNQFNKIVKPDKKTLRQWFLINCFQLFPFLIHKYYTSIFNMIYLESTNGKINHFTRRERQQIVDDKIKNWWKAAGMKDKELKGSQLTVSIKNRLRQSQLNLNELLNFCKDKNWKPVLIMLPYSQDINNRLEKPLLDKICYNNLTSFLEKGILFLDYSHDLRLSSADLYMDMEYLNENGRAVFSEIVFRDLMEKGYIMKDN